MARTAAEYANAILELLRENAGSPSTPYICSRLDVPDTSRDTIIKVLDKLHLLGKIEKYKVGAKYRWKVKVKDWDPRDPFEREDGHTHANGDYSSDLRIKELVHRCSLLEADLVKAKAEANGVRTIKVERWDGSTLEMKDRTLPAVFPKVLALAKCRRNILLVGPAGCGKSYIGKLTSEVLGLGFASLSCTSGMSEAHLLGRSVPDLTHGKNRFQGTAFLDVYENGGVGLLDELDAADPNLLLAVNTGLANGYMNVPNRPDKPVAMRHKDFVCMATANTFGRGATRQYAGRNQLDESTLDRFRIGVVECGYDPAVEKAVCPDEWIRTRMTSIRRKIEAAQLRRVMSTRFMEDAYVMFAQSSWTWDDILDTYLSGWTPEEIAKVK